MFTLFLPSSGPLGSDRKQDDCLGCFYFYNNTSSCYTQLLFVSVGSILSVRYNKIHWRIELTANISMVTKGHNIAEFNTKFNLFHCDQLNKM